MKHTIQYNTIQYNTIQYNTIQYNTLQYNTIQYNTIQYSTVQYNTIQYNTKLQIRFITRTRTQCESEERMCVYTVSQKKLSKILSVRTETILHSFFLRHRVYSFYSKLVVKPKLGNIEHRNRQCRLLVSERHTG